MNKYKWKEKKPLKTIGDCDHPIRTFVGDAEGFGDGVYKVIIGQSIEELIKSISNWADDPWASESITIEKKWFRPSEIDNIKEI